MKLALLAIFLSIPAFSQFSITASAQRPEVPSSYIGKPIPAGFTVYLVQACNESATDASIYVDRIAHELSQAAPLQDGGAVLYAARAVKESNWKVTALKAGGLIAMAAGGYASAGATTVLGQVAGGVGGAAGISALLKNRSEQLARLDVPANWWTPDSTRIAALHSGQCIQPLLMVLGGPDLDPVISQFIYAPGTSAFIPAGFLDHFILKAPEAPVVAPAPSGPIVTHPQVNEEDEHLALVIRMTRENSVRIGAVE